MPDIQDHQQLIEQNQGLVHDLALKILRQAPQSTDLQDLVGYGQIGLAEAAQNYDPSRGVKFSSFAYYRIRGAIYDGLSKQSWFRRRPTKWKYEQVANDLLEQGLEESGEEIPHRTEELVHWFRELAGNLATAHLTLKHVEVTTLASDDVEDKQTPSPQAALFSEELFAKLNSSIEALPDEERTLIQMAYYEGATLTEAADALGISKSWASRLHSKTLQRLQRALRLSGMSE